MTFLVDIAEEIASKAVEGPGVALEFIGTKLAEVGAALEALAERIAALEHHGESPPATP